VSSRQLAATYKIVAGIPEIAPNLIVGRHVVTVRVV